MNFTAEAWQSIGVFIGGIATLGIYSFLIKENRAYRFFEHLFIGISAGMGVIIGIKDFLWPQVLEPMLGLDIVQYPDGTFSKTYEPMYLLYILPMVFGLFYYTIYSKRFSWLAKLVIGFSLGMSGGIAFKGFFNEIMPQVASSFKPLVVLEGEGAARVLNLAASFDNIVFVFTLLAVMLYFFFSFRFVSSSAVAGRVSASGRWLMMVCFGAFFGSTVMARMALLVERIQFLLTEWKDLLVGFI